MSDVFFNDVFDGAILVADALGLLGIEAGPQWGVFLNGEPVVEADQVQSFSFKQDFPISTYPIEQGGFESYDKIQTPYEARVRFVTGGTELDRQVLLDSIDAIVGDLNLYDVVTPEKVYLSCNLVHQDYRRTSASGVGLIAVDVTLMEARVAASAEYNSTTPLSDAQSPTAQDAVSNGTVQTSSPSTGGSGSISIKPFVAR